MDAEPAVQGAFTTRVGADLLVDSLYDAGSRICFANPGTTELGLVSALARDGRIRCVLGLFEGVCTGAADGYARVSGEVPLTLLHLGPGFANGIANLHNARRAGTRIVNLIGDHATWHLSADAPLTSDIHSLASPVSREVVYLGDVDDIVSGVDKAFSAVNRDGGGAATLIIPSDVIDAPSPASGEPVAIPPFARAKVPESAIRSAATALLNSGEVIVLLGSDALSERGIRAGARIASKLRGRLLMEPYPPIVTLGGDLPMLERQAYFPDDVTAQMADAHVLLAGARAPVSYFGYEGWPSQLVPEERLIPLATGGDDAADALEKLAALLSAGDIPARGADVSPASREPNAILSPASVVEELLAQLPEDAIISLEGSTLGGPWLRNAHRARRHRVMTNTGGAIGQGLPCAVGAALAAPKRRVIALQSDGSAQYTLQSLWTMARERLKVTVIMAANHRYAILQTELSRSSISLDDPVTASLTRLDNPKVDWVALAAGYGIEGVRVTTNAELAAALHRGLELDSPLLIQAELP